MSHLHIPDGVLAWWVWAPGLALALLLLVLASRRTGQADGVQVALRGALGGLVLAAMAVELPLGPVDYHLSLAGPLGVLLGAAGAFQVLFVVSAILALAGHGGFTVIGLNALVLGSGAALARPLYRALRTHRSPAMSLALAAGAAQGVSGLAWFAVVGLALRFGVAAAPARLGVLSGIALPLWIVGLLLEGAVGYGLGRFLAKVRPDLLPGVDALAAPHAGAA